MPSVSQRAYSWAARPYPASAPHTARSVRSKVKHSKILTDGRLTASPPMQAHKGIRCAPNACGVCIPHKTLCRYARACPGSPARRILFPRGKSHHCSHICKTPRKPLLTERFALRVLYLTEWPPSRSARPRRSGESGPWSGWLRRCPCSRSRRYRPWRLRWG